LLERAASSTAIVIEPDRHLLPDIDLSSMACAIVAAAANHWKRRSHRETLGPFVGMTRRHCSKGMFMICIQFGSEETWQGFWH
jgi:hypothetical protein